MEGLNDAQKEAFFEALDAVYRRSRRKAARDSRTSRKKLEGKLMRKNEKTAFQPDRIGAYFRLEWLP